jgi:hypothetical protein
MKHLISNARWALLLLVLAAFAGGGCVTSEPENASERPWSTPQGWETGLPSNIGNQYR